MTEYIKAAPGLVREYAALFRGELRGNLNLQRMCWIVVFLLVTYVIFGFQQLSNQVIARSHKLQAELGRVSVASDQAVWQERLDWEQNLQEQLLSRCWTAKSETIASAEMQTVLQQLSTKHDLRRSRLQMAQPVEMLTGEKTVWVLRAQLLGGLEITAIPGLLDVIESRGNPFVVEQLRYQEGRGAGTIDLLISACFRN